jgi:hypothetical protein
MLFTSLKAQSSQQCKEAERHGGGSIDMKQKEGKEECSDLLREETNRCKLQASRSSANQ